jgi:HSP20 family protein
MTLTPIYSRQRRSGGQLAGAPLSRWDPRREMEDINSRFGQLIQSFFGDTAGLAGMGSASMLVPVDVEETDSAYIVDVDLPNVSPDDVTVEMRGEELRIAGMFEQSDRGGIMRRQTRQSGEFEYMVDLPSDIEADRVEATYHNGVLTVTVGKMQDTQPRRIEIRESKENTHQNAMRDGQGAGQDNSPQHAAKREASGAEQRSGKRS